MNNIANFKKPNGTKNKSFQFLPTVKDLHMLRFVSLETIGVCMARSEEPGCRELRREGVKNREE